MRYKLPKKLRVVLAQPQGELFEGPPEQSLPKALEWMRDIGMDLNKQPNLSSPKEFRIVCVGDVVAKAFMEHQTLSKFVKICLIDGNTQRGNTVEISVKESTNIKREQLNNPREFIVQEAFNLIKDAMNDGFQHIVEVIGEEDLLVLPATLESHRDFIFYGQPPITSAKMSIPSGCVGVYSDVGTKNRFKAVLEQFDKES